MMPVFLLKLTILVAAFAAGAIWLSVRIIRPSWWRSRAMRCTFLVAGGAIVMGLGVWGVAQKSGRVLVVHGLAEFVYAAVHLLFPVALAMLAGATLDRGLDWALSSPRERTRTEPPTDGAVALSRRAALCFGGATIPTAIASSSGLRAANQDATVRVVPMSFADLHPDLEGLKILQLSDLHLGVVLGLDDLKRGLERAMTREPDVIVVTGDLSNDPALVGPALELIASAGARYGAFASLGNHEYLVGIDATRAAFEASRVPLLVGASRALRIGRAVLHIGGADDPGAQKRNVARLLRPSIRASLGETADAADFRLLLCHRPEGFAAASALGYDLTLAGHTHGGQLGFMGRSALELVSPGGLWWGRYSGRTSPSGRAARRAPMLYTTSGFGHWFPFRFGCPTEMPLLVLGSAPRRANAVSPASMSRSSGR